MGSGAASEALQAGLPSVLEANSINLAAAAMVTGANCWLAQAHISGGTSKAGVTRDDLSQPVHSGARDTESVVSALIRQAQRLPSELYRSLTWDRGKELADHQRLTLATEVEVYFCDPRSPWQRGSNENTNRLLRQYLPRGTDLSLHSQAKLTAIARQLNERPRKTLLYQTPAEKFAECVAAIG